MGETSASFGRLAAGTIAGPLRVGLAGQRGFLKESLAHTLVALVTDVSVTDLGESQAPSLHNAASLDLVLLDVDSTVDPIGHFTLLRRRFADAYLLAFGRETAPFVVQSILNAGASGYLAASLPMSAVQEALRVVVAGGVYVSPEEDALEHRSFRIQDYTPPGEIHCASPRAPTCGLSPRKLDVLSLLVSGESNKSIARTLRISEKTVKIHVAAICAVLHVDNRTKAAIAGLTILGCHASTSKGTITSKRHLRQSDRIDLHL